MKILASIIFALSIASLSASPSAPPKAVSEKKTAQPPGEAHPPAGIPQAKHDAYATIEADPRAEAPPQRWRYREWWLFGFGVLTLGINGALAYVAWQGIRTASESLKQIERQNATSEKALILQFRPKLVLRGMQASVKDADDGTLLFGYVNTGSSPARIVDGHLKLSKTAGGASGATEELFHHDVVWAKEKSAKQWPRYNPGSSAETIVQLSKPAANAIWAADQAPKEAIQGLIVLSGRITYIDEVGTARHTGIFRRYDSRSSRFLVIEDSDLEYAD